MKRSKFPVYDSVVNNKLLTKKGAQGQNQVWAVQITKNEYKRDWENP